jgi:hypothetical protein
MEHRLRAITFAEYEVCECSHGILSFAKGEKIIYSTLQAFDDDV